ncbi:hypothetical protein B484DRAFT_398025 [Ochromonadaceae sp. CCMP2298]|nr:hypothetical protein B484DRAFT_398025 [Ochromonadaceae sp. CCMP2298]
MMLSAGKRRSALAVILNADARRPKKRQHNLYLDTKAVEKTAKKIKKRTLTAKKAVAARVAKHGSGRSSLLPLLELGIAWWDENHKKVILGHTSKYEVRITRNPFDNEPTPWQFGGIVPDKSMCTSVKFAGEASGCFGAAMVEDATTGVVVGVKAEPFEYTGKWVVGVKVWEAAKMVELLRVLPFQGC